MTNVTTNDLALLESLIVNNPDLERLESLLDQFNIFEALGAVRVELRHSDFLAFLLNPNQSHGLGEVFVKRMLQKALASAPEQSQITPIDLDLYDLDQMLVLREWQNIDILLLDEENRFLTIIENKVGSAEHSDQLRRYRRIARQYYPNLRQVCLFLTPEGDEPSDENYIPIDYLMVAELVEQLVDTRASTLGPDVRTLMTHYSQMLRRHIVSESEIAELCRKIYRKHQRALDLIYEYRPDLQEALRDFLENLVQEQTELDIDHCTKTYVRFVPRDWDVPLLMEGEGWTNTNRMLLFELQNFPDRLKINLAIGPGPEKTRRKLYEMANQNAPLKPTRSFGSKWNSIYNRTWLSPKDYGEVNVEEMITEIRKKWDQFLERDMPQIRKIVDSQAWLHETSVR
jgi:hypothetical protein